MTEVPNPYTIHIELFWQDGTRPNQNEVARVNAFEENNQWRGQSGWDPNTGGWQDLVVQPYPAISDLLNLKFQVVSTSENELHMTAVYQSVPDKATIKIVIGVSDELIPPGGSSGTQFTASGNVTDHTGAVVTVGSVEVCDVTNGQTAVLGTSPLDSGGGYSVTFELADFENNGGQQHSLPNLVVKYQPPDGGTVVEATPSGPVGQHTVINIVLPDPNVGTGDRVVFGEVRNRLGLAVANLFVEAYALSWTTSGIAETKLGEAYTSAAGAYRIPYSMPGIAGELAECGGEPDQVTVSVYVRKQATDPDPLGQGGPVFDAPPELRLDLTVDAEGSGTYSDYRSLHDQLSPCLGSLEEEKWATINSLVERADYMDFVAQASGVEPTRLRAYVSAWVISGEINAKVFDGVETFEKEVVFGLIREGLGESLQELLEAEPSEFLTTMLRAVERGTVSSEFLPRLEPDAENPLQDEWAEILAYYLTEGENAWQADLIRLVIAGDDPASIDRRKEIGRRYYGWEATVDEFFKSLTEPREGEAEALLSDEEAKSLSFVFAVYERGDKFLPLPQVLLPDRISREWETVDDLARVELLTSGTDSGWMDYALQAAQVLATAEVPYVYPGDVPGATNEEKQRIYAERLYDKFGRDLEDTRFTAQLTSAAASSGDPAMQAVAEFLNENPDFDLRGDNLDRYLADNDIEITDPVLLDNLKRTQRVARLTPEYEHAAKLVELGLDSAVAISRVKEADFIATYAEELGGLTSARSIHRLAARYATDVMATILHYHRSVTDAGGIIAFSDHPSFESLVTETSGENPNKYPNWVTLFGAHNNCNTAHCETVLSPGAYLADLLQFLPSSAAQRLSFRRPDLQDMEITCENTELAVPYIDLVNEVLEAAIAPHRVVLSLSRTQMENAADGPGTDRDLLFSELRAAGYVLSERTVVFRSAAYRATSPVRYEWVVRDDGVRFRVIEQGGARVAWGALQTSGTAESPDVFPEHVNEAAYAELQNAIFPFSLPLALEREEIDLLLMERRSSRDEVHVAFRTDLSFAGLLNNGSYALTRLNLMEKEQNAFLSSSEAAHEYFGFSEEAGEIELPRPENPHSTLRGNWLQLLAQVTIFLHRTRISFEDLLDLLETDFINGGDTDPERLHLNARVEDIENCNYFDFQIEHLAPPEGNPNTEPAVERARRLSLVIRLWKRLNLPLRALDHYLLHVEGDARPTDLRLLAAILRTQDATGLSFQDVVALFAPLDRRRTRRQRRSPFDQLYLNGSPDQPEYLVLDGVARGQSTTISAADIGFRSYFRAVFGLSEDAVEVLLHQVADDPDAPSPSVTLDPASASQMARVVRFCRAAKVGVEEYARLRALLVIDPFLEDETDPVTMMDHVVAIHTALQQVQLLLGSKLSVAETDYLLRHEIRSEDGLHPEPDTIARALSTLGTLAGEVTTAYPLLEAPALADVAELLPQVMPADRVARVVTILEQRQPDPVALSSDDKTYLIRYFETFAGSDVGAFVDGFDTESEAERAARLYRSLHDFLVDRERTTKALTFVSEEFGLNPVATDLLLRTALSTVSTSDDPGEKAIVDWKRSLSGGFDSGEGTLVDLPPLDPTAAPRTATLVVPKDGHYRVVAETRGLGSQSELSLSLDGAEISATGTPAEFDLGELKAGSTHALSLTFTGTVDTSDETEGPLRLRLLFRFENEDPSEIPVSTLIPMDERVYLRVHKAALIVRKMRLSEEELNYLAQQPSTVFDQLPLAPSDTPVAWEVWAGFLDAISVNRSLPLQGTSLFTLWREQTVFDAALVSQLTGWRQGDVSTLIVMLGSSDFYLLRNWKVLNASLSLAGRLDLRVSQILELILAEPTLARAKALRGVVRGRHTEASFREVFKPLRDKLRQRQRDALVDYLTSVENPIPGVQYFSDANDLFARFLIDVEMEPDTQISRVRLALNVIQLFVQRGYLGLEGATINSQLDELRAQWEWMGNYRVWEANRKVLLFPENWIEPELRDDKTEFFREFEDELLQDKVTSSTASTLVARYIEKLEEVSHLDVMGMCEEMVFTGGRTGVLHIVARTRSHPPVYYHRTFEGRQFRDGFFTPWRRIDLEIEAESVVPAHFNGRLHLFWPMFERKQKVANGQESDLQVKVDIRLMWSKERGDGSGWSKPRLGRSKVTDFEPISPFKQDAGEHLPPTQHYHFRTEPDRCDGVAIEVIKTRPPQEIPEPPDEPKKWSTNPVRLGVIRVTGAGEDFAYNEVVGHELGLNHPVGTVMLHNGADEVSYVVDNMSATDGFGFHSSESFFGRTPGEYRVVLTNLGHFEPALSKPFVYMTHDTAFFAVHRDKKRAAHLGGDVTQVTAYQTFHHPVLPEIKRRYLARGEPALFDREIQAFPPADGRYYYNVTSNQVTSSGGAYCSGYNNGYNQYGGIYLGYHIAGDSMAFGVAQRTFELSYKPGRASVERPYPLPTVDFSYGTSFGAYNWELFFHIPMLVAERLSQEMRFEEAMQWYHYVFDPRRGLSVYEKSRTRLRNLPPECRYWSFLPFFANQTATASLLQALGYVESRRPEQDEEILGVIEDWRNDPFNPHLIARQRIVAYQKSVVMKYLDNLIAWADQLFRRDSFESINQATQLYILADEILGKRPEQVEDLIDRPPYTYRELSSEDLDVLSNAFVEVESTMVGSNAATEGNALGPEHPGDPTVRGLAFSSLYFKVPRNDRLDRYWDLVADRLFKIRNSMNIDGVKRQLALFEPPIDPALLVRAAASGVDLSNVLAQLNRQLPYYRFNVWTQKATELANEVKSFGGALLAALEKKDAEEIALLRQGHEIRLLELVERVRKDQIKEAEANREALVAQRALAEDRFNDYANRVPLNSSEAANLSLSKTARDIDLAAGVLNSIAGVLGIFPELQIGAFSATAQFGGNNLNNMLTALATALSTASGALRSDAGMAATIAGYERRQEDWDLQRRQAELEIGQIDRQIIASDIRIQIAEKELDNQIVQKEQAEEVQTFLEDKFTNRELYQWMVGQLSRTYQQAYKLAHDVAKTAERAFEFELGVEGANFIQFGYMDGLHQGLLAGEKLGYDIKRMEVAYLEKDKRELEITKVVSLASINPDSLQKLRETGATDFDLNEVLFDLDFPGHYFRRIQAVRVTIPCVTGPYTSVSAKLSLLSSAIRKVATIGDQYTYQGIDDTRFVHDVGGIQSIATSTAQDDAGMFDFNFRDERYLPFEGAGVISRWRLELPTAVRQFDYHSISDVLLTISYTARDAGGLLKEAAQSEVEGRLNSVLEMAAANQTGIARVFSFKREFPDVLHRLLTLADGETTDLVLRPEHFPYMLRHAFTMSLLEEEGSFVVRARVIFKPGATPPTSGASITLDDNSGTLSSVAPLVLGANIERDSSELLPTWDPITWVLSAQNLDVEDVDDVLLSIHYTISPIPPTT